MAKNNKLINSILQIAKRNEETNVQKAADKMAPEAYAAFVIALYARGWRHKRINKLFKETQDIWDEYGARDEQRRMVEVAEELSGILLMNKEEAQKEGIE